MKDPSDDPVPKLNAIIYDIKAGASNEDEINAAFLSSINNGSTSFLAHERIVKDKLM
jgi:hypothetical protein